MKNPSQVTICDVAESAGVAPATVSRVINNHAKISTATVIKVRKVMDSLGYIPSPVAKRQGPRAKRGRSTSYRVMQVALISQVNPFLLNTPIYSKVMRGIETELGAYYYNMIIRNLPKENPWDALPRKIDGAILFGVYDEPARLLKELRAMPCVRIMGSPPDNDFFDHVTYNSSSVGRLAAEYLIKKGHRNIAYIGSDDRVAYVSRHVAFANVMKTSECVYHELINNNLLDESNDMQLPNVREISEIIEKIKVFPEMPTAIYAPADTIVIGLYHTLPHFGITPGKDIEIIGVNNDAIFLNNFKPRPASIDIHPEKIGKEAVKRLLWRINNPKEPLIKLELEPELAFS
ncbi:MAG: LacI family DNA-binding transcriptional regulator [Victivallales bacterium]|nr:LacI family DNA-binding transcriptional regulator [Victivallales bacterium]